MKCLYLFCVVGCSNIFPLWLPSFSVRPLLNVVALSCRTWSWPLCGTTTSATCCPLRCQPMSWSAALAPPAATRSSRTPWGEPCQMDTPSKASPYTSCIETLAEPSPPAWGEEIGNSGAVGGCRLTKMILTSPVWKLPPFLNRNGTSYFQPGSQQLSCIVWI